MRSVGRFAAEATLCTASTQGLLQKKLLEAAALGGQGCAPRMQPSQARAAGAICCRGWLHVLGLHTVLSVAKESLGTMRLSPVTPQAGSTHYSA